MVDLSKHRSRDAMVLRISIPSIEAVKAFVTTVMSFACDAIIESGRYAIDAKSIMGVLSLDVTKPLVLILEIKSNKIDDRIALYDAIQPFLVTN